MQTTKKPRHHTTITPLPKTTTTNKVSSLAKVTTTTMPSTTRIPFSTRKSITTVRSRPSSFTTRIPHTTTRRPPATARSNTAPHPADLLPPPRPPILPPMPGMHQEPHSSSHPDSLAVTVSPTRRLVPNKMFTIPDSNGSDGSRPFDPKKKFVIDEKPAVSKKQSGSSTCSGCQTGTKPAPPLVGIFTIPAGQPQWVIELPVDQPSRSIPGQWTVQVPGKGYTGQWLDISPVRAAPGQAVVPPETHQHSSGTGRRGPKQWTVQVSDTRSLGQRPGGGQWVDITRGNPGRWEVQVPNTGSGPETVKAPAGRDIGQWVLSAGSTGNRDRVTGQWVVEVPMETGSSAWHLNRASVSVTPGWMPVSVATMGVTNPRQHVPAPWLQVPVISGSSDRRTKRQARQSDTQTTSDLSSQRISKRLQHQHLDPSPSRTSSGSREVLHQVPSHPGASQLWSGANGGKWIVRTPDESKQWSVRVPLNEHNSNRPVVMHNRGLRNIPIPWPTLFNVAGNLGGPTSKGRRRREADDWKESPDDEEGEGSSLVFVFDTTGSMSPELGQVKRQAKELAMAMIRHPKKPIYNYIFVPFNDPEVGPPTVTRDPDEFQNMVDAVVATGGGDCAEMSLRAIRTALRLSRPKSYIYVFTDAGSKESFLTEDVLDLIQKKGSLVMILLTGQCESQDYFVYSNITNPSSGAVFDLDKSQISQVLDFIESYIERNRVSLMNVNSAQGSPERPYPLPIDSSINIIEVSVSGKKPVLNVLDPEGKKAVPPQLEHTLNLTNIQAVKIKDPEPGVWTVKAGSESVHSVRSSAVTSSDFNFNYGFSVIPTSKISETAHRPLIGRENSLLITSSVASSLCNLTEVRLVDLDGRVLAVLPLKEIDGRAGIYSAGAVSPPNSFFNIEIQGFDENGHLLKRIFNSAVKPQTPNLPSISGRSEVSVRSGGQALLECQVESLVPVSVSWYKDGNHLATHLYNQSSRSVYEIDEISQEARGNYSCVAGNLAGKTSKHITVIIADPPMVQVVPVIGGDVGLDLWLPCFISSTLPANLSWFRMNPSSTPGSSTELYEKMKNSYSEGGDRMNFGYMIEGVTVEEAGRYACVAENRVGREKGVVDVRVAAQPEVEPPPAVHHRAGSDQLVLRCRLGRPDYSVSVQWSKQGRPITKNHTIIDGTEENGYEHQLIIYNPTEEDEGLYQCAASNHIGSSEGTVAVIWIMKPVVQPVTQEVLVEGGGSALLTCIVHEGKPQPSISWYREHAQITVDTYKYKMMVNGSLVVEEVGPNDGGLYQCRAENEAGTDSAWLTLTIGHRPRIRPVSDRWAVRWGGAVEVDCWAKGEPTPSVSWHHQGSLVASASQHALLSLSAIKMNNSGLYTCIAENSHGKDEAQISVAITDLERPKILKGAGGVDVLKALPGQRVELRCEAHGTPPPEYIWYKDNLQLGYLFKNYQITNGSLVIPVMSYRHVGEYKCVAKNPLGEDSKLFTVQNYVTPKISMNFGSYVTGLVGSNASLPCHVTGDPLPVVSWTRDSQQDHYIKHNRGLKSPDSNHLHIYNITEEDAGRYICKAENIAGVARRALVLSVLSPPKIVSLASETTALSGDVVFLSCNARGIPRPSVSWLKNGSPLHQFKGSLGNNYIRFFAELDDSGNYTCVAKNKHGQAQSTTLLTVLEPPRIADTLPGRVDGIEGQPLELPCSVSGSPKPVVAWHYRGQILHKAIDNYENSVPLKIDKLGLRDGGYYMCIASNKAGSARRSVELTVLVPPEIVGWEEEIRALPGDTVAVECRAHGSPRPTLAWLKEGNTLPHEFFVSDGTLRFIAETSHSSNYTCVATNKAGTDQRNLFINIYEVPQFPAGQNEELEVVKGESVDLRCSAVGDPVPQLTWFHNGRLLHPTKRITVRPGNDGVTIRKATEADEGIYECTATNKAGTATRRIKLSVLVRPWVRGWPLVTSLKEGEEVVLRCETKGRPPPSISWYKDNQPLLTAKGHILRFIATSSEKGNYSCVARNQAGENNTSTVLQVKVPASISAPLEESLVVQLDENVELVCEAQGLPEPSVTWFYNKTTINQSHPDFQVRRGKLLIDSVQVRHSGDYLCVAENEIGRAQKAFTLTVHVAPRITDDGNELIYLKEGDDYSISCSAYGVPAPDMFWIKEDKMFKKGYYEDHYIVLEDNTLIISDAQESMQGVHTCLATNIVGTASKNYNVQVTVPPWYGYSNEDNATLVEIEESDTGVLTCPLPDVTDVQWLQNGESVDLRPNTRADDVHIQLGEGGRSLTITEAFPSDSGLYECLAGGQRAAFRVEVLVSPHLLDEFPHSGPYRLTEGDSLTLNCSASGNPPPKIRWREVERGLPVTRHTLPGVLVKGANREVLHWPSVRGHHSGRYSCTATNRAGIEARLFHLIITESPKVVGPAEVKLSAKIGDTVLLNCTLTGNPKPKISWKHVSFNGREKPLSSSTLSLDQDKAVLRIESQQDSGYYLCNGTNPIGSVTKTFVLDVLERPAVEGEEELVRQPEGSEAALVCRGGGRPTPDVSWSRGQWPLAPSQGSVLTESSPGRVTSTLTIPRLYKKDDASYVCTLSNHLGSAQKIFQLKVIVAPVLSDGSSSSVVREVEVVEGRGVRLECPVVDTGDVQVRWEVSRGGNKGLSGEQGGGNKGLSGEQGGGNKGLAREDGSPDGAKDLVGVGTSLVLSSASLHDQGLYICTASNEAGAAQASFKLTLLVPPKFDASEFEERVRVLLEGEVVFNCSIHSKPSSVVTWLKGSSIIEDGKHYKLIDGNQTLIISDASYTDSGTYTCIASNTAGSAERNFDVHVQGAPSVGAGSSEEATLTELSIKRFRRAVLKCPLTGSPPPAIHWYKNEKMLESDEMNVFILSEGRKMFIMRAMEADAGRYHCLAENSAGVHKLDFILNIIVGEEWSDWSEWGGCWPSCGGGSRARSRSCGDPHLPFSPFVTYDNTSCQGPTIQTQPCNQHPCPVDGVWGEWSAWSECSAACGEGERSRERRCEGPSWGGEPCRGAALEEEVCSLPPCPVHGTWSEWSEWSECTVSCRGGLRFRERRCQGTAHGGLPCQGNSRDIVPCNNHPCPVDGRWSAWSGWGSCSASCGPGKRTRHRYCYRSRYNGKPCSGPKKQVEDCFNRECTQRGRIPPEMGSLRYRSHPNRHSNRGYTKSTLMPQADGRSAHVSREHSGIQYATGVESFVRPEDLVAEEKRKESHDGATTDAVILIGSPAEVADAPVSREDGTFLAMRTHTTKLNPHMGSPDNIPAGTSPRFQKLNIYDRFCPPGFKRTSSKNNCADVDECRSKRYNKCHTSREICRNLIGSYSCICAAGYETRGSRCRDVDECERGISKCSHYCHNSPGSYKCSCPDGLILLADNSTCHTDQHDYQSDSYEDSASQDYEFMEYITSTEDTDQDASELIEQDTTSEEILVCPKGFIRENNACKDVNECDEGIDWCNTEQLCINSKGSYRCLDTPCPPSYDLEPKIKSCVMMCSEEGKQCGGGAAVMEAVSYLSVDTTLSNLTVMHELLRLTPYDEALHPLRSTNFTIEKNDYQLPVDIRAEEDGSGTLYAVDELHIKKMLRMTLVATTYREDGKIVYITQYYVFIYNSAYEIS